MAQAGRSRRMRKTRRGPSEGMVSAYTRTHTEATIRKGVVPGAEPEVCPVCGANSEGWYIEGGKRTWYHFARSFPCVQKVNHIEAEGENRGPVPGVW